MKLRIHMLEVAGAGAGQEVGPSADAGEARRANGGAVRRVYARAPVVLDVGAVLLAAVVQPSSAALEEDCGELVLFASFERESLRTNTGHLWIFLIPSLSLSRPDGEQSLGRQRRRDTNPPGRLTTL